MNPSNKNTTFNFIIRDDDLCFFSKPEHIIAAYREVFIQNIPVSFSTIPFITLPNDAWLPRPLPVPEDSGIFPISQNQELVQYIKNNPLIEITQHGCAHQTSSGVFEYAQRENLFEATLRGKEELEKTFGKPITVFVAPHDQFSSHGILAIENAGLNIIRGKGTKDIRALFKMIVHRWRFITRSVQQIPAYPHAMQLGHHQEAFGIRVEVDRESLFKALYFAHKTRGNFILVNHIHDFSESRKQVMLELIKEAKKLDARFIKARDLFN